MSAQDFSELFAAQPLIAILRGVRPDEIVAITNEIYEAGIRIVEVPLNSPQPLQSIARLNEFAGRMIYGAGTVLRPDDVRDVAAAGGKISVSPHTDERLIATALQAGMTPVPGFSTATEAFRALESGAKFLKLFPASTHGTSHLKALKAVLPAQAAIIPVGGVGPAQMRDWWAVGARGFGLGSELYKAGMTAAEVRERAIDAVSALRAARTTG
jgi:2-dehydro-3-deoxyphosphogalactonate aldolase